METTKTRRMDRVRTRALIKILAVKSRAFLPACATNIIPNRTGRQRCILDVPTFFYVYTYTCIYVYIYYYTVV